MPNLHPNNPHQGRYNITLLCDTLPELQSHVIENPMGDATIDFSNPTAVKLLNKSLLFQYYRLTYWDIPEGFLCPPTPSRADYIHHIADVFGLKNSKSAKGVHALDIGTGANLIYPIIGVQAYGWRFTATDIDPISVENAKFIRLQNPTLKNKIRVKLQKNSQHIFKGIITAKDYFDVTICNPPFHASLEEATASNQRKQRNLVHHRNKRANISNKSNNKQQNNLNFGGQKAELWCEGGEIGFLKTMANESQQFARQVAWFTTLVSKSENVAPLIHLLKKLGVKRLKEIKMQHGQKSTRIIAWGW